MRLERWGRPVTLDLALSKTNHEFRPRVRLAYLFSRYPIVSQTFCDTEILALEKLGFDLELYSIYPPPTSFRHGHAQRMEAEIHYAPPGPILKLDEAAAKKSGRWPLALIADHERRFGPQYKPALRARNALYFADLFQARGITHFHVHFANRAAVTAIFLKAISGIPYSISTHGQDFMSDLGSDDLLREMCKEAVFVANETEFSKGLVVQRCPESTAKMFRVFNGMELANFSAPTAATCNPAPKIVSIGRLIEFKGFHHLIAACAKLRWRGLEFECEIIGEGPWRTQLECQIEELHLEEYVRLSGALPQEEVFDALRGCDIFALACTTDQLGASDVFPTVILEAMASAKPVVSTRLAGVPEQIVDGRSGLLVEPGDEAGLAEALERLLTEPDRRRQIGQAGRQRVEDEFSIEHTVIPLKELFEQHVPLCTAPPRAPIGYACLLTHWPPRELAAAEIRDLRHANPRLRVFANDAAGEKPKAAPFASLLRRLRISAGPASGDELSPATLDLLPAFAFLPDGMVLEGEWQQERELARRLETWRVQLGEKVSSEEFLRHARRALYLRRTVELDEIRHIHALSGDELLSAWLLHRLCGISFSVTLDAEEAELSESALSRILRDASGVRARTEDLRRTPWLEEIKGASGEKLPVLRRRRGEPVEPAWLQKLAAWGGRTNG